MNIIILLNYVSFEVMESNIINNKKNNNKKNSVCKALKRATEA